MLINNRHPCIAKSSNHSWNVMNITCCDVPHLFPLPPPCVAGTTAIERPCDCPHLGQFWNLPEFHGTEITILAGTTAEIPFHGIPRIDWIPPDSGRNTRRTVKNSRGHICATLPPCHHQKLWGDNDGVHCCPLPLHPPCCWWKIWGMMMSKSSLVFPLFPSSLSSQPIDKQKKKEMACGIHAASSSVCLPHSPDFTATLQWWHGTSGGWGGHCLTDRHWSWHSSYGHQIGGWCGGWGGQNGW